FSFSTFRLVGLLQAFFGGSFRFGQRRAYCGCRFVMFDSCGTLRPVFLLVLKIEKPSQVDVRPRDYRRILRYRQSLFEVLSGGIDVAIAEGNLRKNEMRTPWVFAFFRKRLLCE